MLLRLPRRLLRPLPAAAALAVLLGAGTASAQITINSSVSRDIKERGTNYHPLWINHSDCVLDGNIKFTVNLPSPDYKSNTLEVWVGSASSQCGDINARTGNSPTCWNVYSHTATTNTSFPVEVRMQDIVGQHKSNEASSGPGSGTPQDCENASSDSPNQLTLYFMLVTGTGDVVANSQATYTDLWYDLAGPSAPTNIKTGIAENKLKVSWSASSSADLVGYHIFCDPPRAGSTSQPLEAGTDAAGGGGGSDAAVGTGGTGGTGGTTGSGGAAATGGSGGSGGGTSDAGSDAASYNPNCPSGALQPGKIPDHAYLCGEVLGQSTTSGYADKLVNNTVYAVAVTGFDGVQNDGPLSDVQCGTPQPVNDFWDEYTQAGGKGGGGFCGIADNPAPGAGGAFLLALFAGFLRRRRRQRS